jgi:hypothetical protein
MILDKVAAKPEVHSYCVQGLPPLAKHTRCLAAHARSTVTLDKWNLGQLLDLPFMRVTPQLDQLPGSSGSGAGVVSNGRASLLSCRTSTSTSCPDLGSAWNAPDPADAADAAQQAAVLMIRQAEDVQQFLSACIANLLTTFCQRSASLPGSEAKPGLSSGDATGSRLCLATPLFVDPADSSGMEPAHKRGGRFPDLSFKDPA